MTGSVTLLLFLPGVLSEEQIRSKKIKKQQQDEDVRISAVLAPPSPSLLTQDIVHLTPQQEDMIQQLVSAQQQCNKRSFSDQPKVTVCFLTGLYSPG